MLIRTLTVLSILLIGLQSNVALSASKIGESIPHKLEFTDHKGEKASFDTLKGEKGLVVFFVRSADWCPFCKNQMIDFGKNYAAFKKKGYEVVSVSYDPVSVLKQFADQKNIPYRMLSDTDSASIKAFGILNKKYKPGSRFYGIPQPAVYVINNDGVITHLFSEGGYQSRPPIGGILLAIE